MPNTSSSSGGLSTSSSVEQVQIPIETGYGMDVDALLNYTSTPQWSTTLAPVPVVLAGSCHVLKLWMFSDSDPSSLTPLDCSVYSSWKFSFGALGGDALVTSTDFNNAVDWGRVSVANGRICVSFDTDNDDVKTWLGADDHKTAWIQLRATSAGVEEHLVQFRVDVLNASVMGLPEVSSSSSQSASSQSSKSSSSSSLKFSSSSSSSLGISSSSSSLKLSSASSSSLGISTSSSGDTIYVCGTLTPDCTGAYQYGGVIYGQPWYVRNVGGTDYFVWYWDVGDIWQIKTDKVPVGADVWTKASGTVEGTYAPSGTYTGTATVSQSPC